MNGQETEVLSEASKLTWTSRREFVISLLGYSLGLGDVWRVPYLTYKNGGGAFLIPYLFFMLVCGIPLYFLEIMMSQYSGKGVWSVWDFCPLFRGRDWDRFLVLNWMFCIYYMINKAWIVEYILGSFSSELPWKSCTNEWNTPNCIASGAANKRILYNVTNNLTTVWPEVQVINSSVVDISDQKSIPMSAVEEFWSYKVQAISSGIDDIGYMNWKYVLYTMAGHVIIWISLVKSVQSIGKMMYVTALAPIVLVIIIWIRALTLPGSSDGMAYFITPDFQRLAHVEVWIEAAFMAFYTLGPAWGGLAMHGCHNKFADNCYQAAVFSTVMTVTYGVFNGLVIFSILGVLAHETRVPIDQIITSGGFSLGFVAYPQAITYFPVPQVWSVLFFIVLLMQALDIQAGIYMFQLIDWHAGTWSVLVIAVIESVLFAWVYGGDRLNRDTQWMLDRQLPLFIRFSTAFLIPVALTLLIVASIFRYKPPSYGIYEYPGYAQGIGWCVSLASIIPVFIYMIYVLKQQDGPLKQRLIQLLRPSEKWMPSANKVKPVFKRSERNYRPSFKRLFIFNLTGYGEWDKIDDETSFEMMRVVA